MTHSHYQQLLDRARKAGLNTTELYRALASRQVEADDAPSGTPDSNGYIAQVQANGHCCYRPHARR